MSARRVKLAIFLVTCGLTLSSCSIIRGYRADGLYGPNIFSFEHHVHDTVPIARLNYGHNLVKQIRGLKFRCDPGYYALGICQQVLYVNPHKNLVMVRIGLDNGHGGYIPAVFDQLSEAWR